MLRRKLGLVFRKQWVKYSSTSLSPKPLDDLPEEIISEGKKEKNILQNPDYFNVHNLFTVKDLFDAKVHYGHHEISLTRNMKPFVFGSRLGHVIFDLDITAYHLRAALNFTAHIAYRNGIILFVSKNPRMTLLVENTAKECKEYAVTREWMFGTLTNAEMYKVHLRLPDLCIFLNTMSENGYEHLGIIEAAKMCIPTVGIVDSNCTPNLITYPVPGNDDSFSSIQLYLKLFKEAILRGKNERKKHLEAECKAEPTTQTVQSSKETIASTKSVLGIEDMTVDTTPVLEMEELSVGTETVFSNEKTTVDTNKALGDEKIQKKEPEFDKNVNNENVKEK